MRPALPIEINLTAVLMAVEGQTPLVYAARGGESLGLPSGPFDPLKHRTLEIGLRSFAQEQAGQALGYVEQLYTFGDRGRHAAERARGEVDASPHVVSIGYLALTRIADRGAAHFAPLYACFPWEDWRGGKPALIDAMIRPALESWARGADQRGAGIDRRALSPVERVALYFGSDTLPFDEEKVLERYELLYEA
ncbi:MAG: NAD regulator, partial [Hyphomicrobiales bacterium]|nr:NAD regulator [Hyphomicrobiales bacterium]